MQIGVLGGTFNPPHIGHLVCAQEALEQLGLDAVVLVPAAVPPHKPLDDDPGAEHRFELCRLAAGNDERLRVSRIELDRPGPSYTVDTLRLMREYSPDNELTLIVGGDMAHSLPSWHEPEALLELATLAVAERAGAPRDDIAARLRTLRGGDRVEFFDMPRIDISSSLVRRRVATGRSIHYLVPDAVADYVAEHGLYRDVTAGVPA
jgi:nicotinate-nucleotide adenylyltransferase